MQWKKHRRLLREGDRRHRRCAEALITTHDTQCLKSPIIPGFWHDLGRLAGPPAEGVPKQCVPSSCGTAPIPQRMRLPRHLHAFTHRRVSNSTPRRIIRSAMSSRVNRDPGSCHYAIDGNISPSCHLTRAWLSHGNGASLDLGARQLPKQTARSLLHIADIAQPSAVPLPRTVHGDTPRSMTVWLA